VALTTALTSSNPDVTKGQQATLSLYYTHTAGDWRRGVFLGESSPALSFLLTALVETSDSSRLCLL